MSNARELAQIPSTPSGRRNLIINGAMTVAQRDDEVTGQTETNGYKTVDRFQFWTYSGGTYTLSQSDEAPNGFAHSHKVENTTTATTLAGTGVTFRQRLEAQDLQHLDYNTSGAKSVTLSFWVRSSDTGTYAIRLYNPDSGRMTTKTYVVSSANTWEKKEITFSGDTAGVINNNNGYAFEFAWWLAAGTDFTSGSASGSWETYSSTKEANGHTVNLNGGGDWYITGVQLEVGTVATEFEHRSYGEELALCQRYYEAIPIVNDQYWTFATPITTTALRGTFEYSEKRTSPTISFENTTVFINPKATTATISAAAVSSRIVRFNFASTGLTVGQTQVVLNTSGNTNYIYVDSEL